MTPESAAGAPVGGSRAGRKRDSFCCAAAVATSLGANGCPTGPETASPRSARRCSSFLAFALAFHARLYAKVYARAQTTYSSAVIPAWAGGRPATMMSTGGCSTAPTTPLLRLPRSKAQAFTQEAQRLSWRFTYIQIRKVHHSSGINFEHPVIGM